MAEASKRSGRGHWSGGDFFALPVSLMDAQVAAGLDEGALLVYLALARHARFETGLTCPPVSTIAAECRRSERAVQHAIKRLIEAGLIALVRRGGGRRADGSGIAATYQLLSPGKGQPRRLDDGVNGDVHTTGYKEQPRSLDDGVYPEVSGDLPRSPDFGGTDRTKRKNKETMVAARAPLADPLGDITPDQLRDDAKLDVLFKRAVAAKLVAGDSEHWRLRFWSMAEHASTGKNPGGMFKSNVMNGRWHHGSQASEDRARDRLRRMSSATTSAPLVALELKSSLDPNLDPWPVKRQLRAIQAAERRSAG